MATTRVYEVIKDFSKGMWYGSAVTDYPVGTSTLLRNVCIKQGQYIGSRAGFEKYTRDKIFVNNEMQPITGICEYNKGSTRVLIVTAGTKVYTYDHDSGAFTDVGLTITAGHKQHFVKFYDSIIMYNGVDLPVRYNGTTWTILASAPISPFMASYRGNLFARDADYEDMVRWSDFADPTTWDADNDDMVSDCVTDPIIAIRKVKDTIGALALSEEELWMLMGGSASSFAFYPLASGVGAVCSEPLQVVNGIPIWLDEDGFYTLSGSETNINPVRFSQLDSVFTDVDMSRIDKAWGITYKGGLNRNKQYLCGLTIGTGLSKNNYIFSYDFGSGGWRYDTNMPCDVFCHGKDSNGRQVIYAASNDGWVYKMYTGTSDNGKEIACSYISYPIYFKQMIGDKGVALIKNTEELGVWYRSKYPSEMQIMVTSDFLGETFPNEGDTETITLEAGGDPPTQYELDTMESESHFLRLQYANYFSIPLSLSGNYFQIRITCNDPNQDWDIYQMCLKGNVVGVGVLGITA